MSVIKERPILFSAPMVRAILEGRKTVTRREIKPSMRSADTQFELHQQENGSWLPLHTFDESCMDDQGTEHPIKCPYGQPGDRLWVRETFKSSADCRPPVAESFIYAADLNSDGRTKWAARWKPSIHMPRIASRILLEITDVRVERLQDISRADIRAEGLQCPPELASDDVSPNYRDWYPAAWRDLWESINGPGSWDANPWCWAVSFRRIEP